MVLVFCFMFDLALSLIVEFIEFLEYFIPVCCLLDIFGWAFFKARKM